MRSKIIQSRKNERPRANSKLVPRCLRKLPWNYYVSQRSSGAVMLEKSLPICIVSCRTGVVKSSHSLMRSTARIAPSIRRDGDRHRTASQQPDPVNEEQHAASNRVIYSRRWQRHVQGCHTSVTILDKVWYNGSVYSLNCRRRHCRRRYESPRGEN